VHLRKVGINGFRAGAKAPLNVDVPGRFSVLVGANGVGKTTINNAIYWAHYERFPRLQPPTRRCLGRRPEPPRRVWGSLA
jgi:putative ATP-dependent endonuclease of OLD family